jgi:hypothetical protein
MPRRSPTLLISITSTAVAALLWALSLAATFCMLSHRMLSVEVAAACTASVIAAVCWLEGWRINDTNERLRRVTNEYRRREAALIKTAAYAAGAQTTGPQPVLYPVR